MKMQWIKLKDTFFRDKIIKKLKLQDAELVLVYLEMLTASIQSDGKLYFDGVEASIEEEIALELDEDTTLVKEVLDFLRHINLVKEDDEGIELLQYREMIGAESESAERVRKHRAKVAKTANCNADVTECNESVTLDIRDKNRDIRESERTRAREEFIQPTVEEVRRYLTENGKPDYAKEFIDLNKKNNWVMNGEKMFDWQRAVDCFVKDKGKPIRGKPKKSEGFTTFEQRKYNYDSLETQLLRR